MMSSPVLELSRIGISYGVHEVVRNLNLRIDAGESVALMGPSGSGKSSLLSCITGLLTPVQGKVYFFKEVMSELSPTHRAVLRRQSIGLICQDPDLLPELTVAENCALLLLIDGVSRSVALAMAQEKLAAVGIAEHSGKRVHEISGGQAQRVSVARALTRSKLKLLVADEPTASLDAAMASTITEVLISGARQANAGLILATHDRAVAEKCDRIVHLGLVAA